MSFEVKVGRQAFLESIQSGLPLDFCVNETFREHRVGSQQRDGIRNGLFNLARFWPLYFDSCEQFRSENPDWLRQLDLALSDCFEKDFALLLKKHLQKKPLAEKDIANHLRHLHPIKNFFFEEMRANPADWHDYLHSLLAPAPFTVRLNPTLCSSDEFMARYREFEPVASEWIPNAFHFRRRWNVADDVGFTRGIFEVQDEHSQLISLLSGADESQVVLDLCAGGGGKTMHLASLMRNRGQIYAYDVSKKKLLSLSERARRAGLTNIRVCENPTLWQKQSFDLILIDAPCSGLGTLRRSPDRLLHLQSEELANLRRVQLQLLQQASTRLRPGGRIVYATCTSRPAENIRLLETFCGESGRDFESPVPALRKALGNRSDSFLTAVKASPAYRVSELRDLERALQFGPSFPNENSQTSGTLVGDGFFVALVK